MDCKGKYEAEVYKLTVDNIEEISAWCKWVSAGISGKATEQYLYHGDKKCNIGEYMVQQKWTGNHEFYVLTEKQFIQIFTKIII